MPKRSSKPDINEIAAQIVRKTTGNTPSIGINHFQIIEADQTGKNPAAVALGRLGGLKGGHARREKLSPSQRKKIARKAAKARWKKRSD